MPPFSLAFDLSRLLAPLSLMIFSLLVDTGTRLIVPALRDYLETLLGIPQTIQRWLQQKLARTNRNSRELQKRGVLTVLIMIVVGIGIALGAEKTAHLHRYAIYVIWFFFWRWSVAWTLARDVLLLPTPTPNSYRIIYQRRLGMTAPIADQADAATLYRATIVTMLTTLVSGLAAPLFYTLLAVACGYPFLYGGVLGCMAGILKAPGHLDTTQLYFYRLSNALAQGLLYIPGRIIALIVLLATLFTPKAKSWTALKMIIRQGHIYPDQSVAWLVAIVSGAFGLAFPVTRGSQWLGNADATAQIGKGAVQLVVWLHAVTVALVLLILCAALLLSM